MHRRSFKKYGYLCSAQELKLVKKWTFIDLLAVLKIYFDKIVLWVVWNKTFYMKLPNLVNECASMKLPKIYNKNREHFTFCIFGN